MYQQHFGLKKRPFPDPAAGSDVFVGPQTATAMAALQKAMTAEDSAVSVSGPAGVGKTTVVKRALDGVGTSRLMISIGRIKLGHDEVLELLLAGLGARQLPKSTVQRFATLRRLLQQKAEKNMRVIVLVEDATRVGVATLAELEALTAADAGVSNGANIVLMGDEGLVELLRDPKLGRLKQRVRQQQSIQPLSAGEMLGYLKHGFRVAGKEFDTLFAPGSADLLHLVCDGTPRLVNNLIESTLTSAAERQQEQISVELIERIAADEFGLTAQHSVAEMAAVIEKAKPEAAIVEAVPEPEPPVVEAVPELKPPVVEAAPELKPPVVEAAPELKPPVVEAVPEPKPPVVEAAPELKPPVIEAEPEPPIVEPLPEPEPPVVVASEDEAIPEFIQDTLPDLAILSPDLVKPSIAEEEPPALAEDAQPQATTASTADASAPSDDNVPTLFDSARLEVPVEPTPPAPAPAAESVVEPAAKGVEETPVQALEESGVDVADDEIPEWERDPTLAQLRPDLDALERAMAAAQGVEPESEAPIADPIADPVAKATPDESPAPALEITLDREIQAKIEEATEALKQTNFDIESDLAGDAPQQADKKPKISDTQIQRMAADLAKAESIEDMDDKLAETLFGEEISMIAAQIVANPPKDVSANDDDEKTVLELEEPEVVAAAPPTNRDSAPAINVQAPKTQPAGNVGGSPTQRLATLRELNSNAPPPGAPSSPLTTESIVMAVEPPPITAPTNGAKDPECIEDQINTSMTATLKALSVRPESFDDDDDDDDGKKKGGFFSRFKRS